MQKGKEYFYFTCGQIHRHVCPNGKIWDKDSVIQILAEDENKAREWVFNTFGVQWSMTYTSNSLNIEYYPNGIAYTREV